MPITNSGSSPYATSYAQALVCGPGAGKCVPKKTATLTDEDNGKTITVPKGTPVVVALSSNPSTGYDWIVTSTNRSFGYPSSVEFTPGAGGAVGSGGTKKLTWKTDGAYIPQGSEHKVRLDYVRPWAADEPAKTFSFTVRVA